MTFPSAIVLGGGPIAVPVARSLGRAGVAVYALGSAIDPVRHSRYCTSFVDLGAGEGVQARWLEWLRHQRMNGAVILPCSDDALELIARHRQSLVATGYRAVESRDAIVLAMLDKLRTHALAEEVGVPAPRTVLVSHASDVATATAGIEFPLALKPRHSHLFARRFGLAQKVFVASDRRELVDHFRSLEGLGLDMLVTEIIPGADDSYHSYYSYLDRNGQPLFHLTKRKLRQYPVGFGLTTYHVIDHHEETIELGLRFFKSIGLRGVACIEFKRDSRDGRLKLIECNHRFTAGHELVRHAGIDLALLAYSRAVGLPDPRLDSHRTGIYMWHPVEDARAFRSYHRRGNLTLLRWIRTLLHRQHFPLFDLKDPKPSLASLSRLPRRLLGGLT